MPAVLALLASLMWGTSDFLGGTAARRVPAVAVVALSQGLAFALLVPLALLVGARPGAVLATGVAAGALGPLSLLAFYRALAVGTMGVVAPVAALGVAVPVLAGLAAGESPAAQQLAGIVVAVVGVVLASGPELRGAGRGGPASLLLALVAALGFGAVFVLLARGAGGSGGGLADVVAVLVVMRGTSAAGFAAVLGGRALARRTRSGAGARTAAGPTGAGPSAAAPSAPAPSAPAPSAGTSALRPVLPVIAVVGVLEVLANASYALATQRGLVSVTAVLASLYPVVTGLLAWRVHGERLVPVQWVGVALAMTGVVLLAAG